MSARADAPTTNALIPPPVKQDRPELAMRDKMAKKTKVVEEKESIKEKLLGGKEVKQVERKESEDILGRKKVEQTVTKKKED
jgi:hypothetical protein